MLFNVIAFCTGFLKHEFYNKFTSLTFNFGKDSININRNSITTKQNIITFVYYCSTPNKVAKLVNCTSLQVILHIESIKDTNKTLS